MCGGQRGIHAPSNREICPSESDADLELSRHEVIDDRVNGRVDVAHAVGDDAGVHQHVVQLVVGLAVLVHRLIHDILRNLGTCKYSIKRS